MRQAPLISLGALWDETVAFLRAEFALVAPVAFLGFGLPMLILLLVMPMPAEGTITPGPWLWWLLPVGLFSMLGSLTVSALALRPGASVRECLGLGVRRMPGAIGLELLNAAFQAALVVPVLLAMLAEGASPETPGPVALIANLAGLALQIWLFVRVLPIWALQSERPRSPVDLVRDCFRLTRGHYRKLLLLRVTALLAGFVALLVVVVPVDAVLGLLGRLPGLAAVTATIGYVVTAAATAVVMAIWTVYCARLYRRLESLRAV